MTLISVVTPVYNAEKYLEDVYNSLSEQSHQDWEWLVTEDCSSDNSFEMLKSIAERDPRVKLSRNNENSGAAVARNVSLERASGEYVAFLDADDCWLPNKLEKQLAFMLKTNSTFCCHNYHMIDETGKFMKEVGVPEYVKFENLLAYNPLGISFVMLKRSVIGDIRFDVTLKRRQDWVFWYHLIQKEKVCHSTSEVLGSYRKDSIHSISKNKFHMALIQWKMYRNYFHLGFFRSIKSFLQYATYGITKHYL